MFRNVGKIFKKAGFGPRLVWIFFGLGLVLLSASGAVLMGRPRVVSFETKPELLSEPTQVYPQRIKISSLGIDLPVFGVEITDNDWPVFEDGASYLSGSGVVGKEGNAVIFAHNKKRLFGPLAWIREGGIIEVGDSDGKAWVYEVEQILTVSPSDVGVLSSRNYPALTLYTCTGFLDQKRLVVVGRLK